MLNLIKKHEGLASKDKSKIILCNQQDIDNNVTVYPYYCPANKPTIGWGCVIDFDKYKNGITVKECEALLQTRVNEFLKQINALNLNLHDNQQEAILSFCYNLGFTAFKNSTLLKEIKANNTSGIKEQWIKWCNIGKIPNKGLLKRRNEELELFLR